MKQETAINRHDRGPARQANRACAFKNFIRPSPASLLNVNRTPPLKFSIAFARSVQLNTCSPLLQSIHSFLICFVPPRDAAKMAPARSWVAMLTIERQKGAKDRFVSVVRHGGAAPWMSGRKAAEMTWISFQCRFDIVITADGRHEEARHVGRTLLAHQNSPSANMSAIKTQTSLLCT